MSFFAMEKPKCEIHFKESLPIKFDNEEPSQQGIEYTPYIGESV